MRATALCLVLLGALGCQAQVAEKNEPNKAPGPVPTNAGTIPTAPVSGTILKQPFTLATARYSVDRRPNYEKIEIQLLAAKLANPCEATGMNHEPAVWIRRTGNAELKAEVVRVDPEQATPWEAHYEIFEDGDWRGNGTARVILELREPAADMKLSGEIYACFGDRTQSCVSGGFVATNCPSRIDAMVRGTDLMERPPPRTGKPAKEAADPGVIPNTEEGPPGAPRLNPAH